MKLYYLNFGYFIEFDDNKNVITCFIRNCKNFKEVNLFKSGSELHCAFLYKCRINWSEYKYLRLRSAFVNNNTLKREAFSMGNEKSKILVSPRTVDYQVADRSKQNIQSQKTQSLFSWLAFHLFYKVMWGPLKTMYNIT